MASHEEALAISRHKEEEERECGRKEGGGNEVVEIRKGEPKPTLVASTVSWDPGGVSFTRKHEGGIDRNARTLDMTGRDKN